VALKAATAVLAGVAILEVVGALVLSSLPPLLSPAEQLALGEQRTATVFGVEVQGAGST